MKKVFLICICCAVISIAFAQKKLVAVTQSPLTGISLPAGSKQDSRMLTVAGAKLLLEIESKKLNFTLSATEVLLLPPITVSGFNADSLVKNLSDMGWTISVVEGDKKYAWLQKDNRHFIMYFSMDAKETGLYFAIAAPVQNGQGNNIGTMQRAPTKTNQIQQKNEPVVQTIAPEIIQKSTQPAVNSGFAFTTTNFDDGWTSNVKEDWVEVTKANLKVLIHYPKKAADAHNFVLLDGLKTAWDVLVAPRYSSASNMEFKPLTGWQSIEFAEADMVETAIGKLFHVVLFKMNYSNGNGKYLEFISSNKNSFEQEFGAYHATTYGWEKMESMANYNKFAVAASDLSGKWSNDFSGMTQYVNAYTGADAGANTHASNQNFEFGAGNTYKWDLGVASGFVGNIKFQSVNSSGKFSVPNNWQIYFSDMEGKPKTYNAYFTCIKNARVLWIGETGFGKKE